VGEEDRQSAKAGRGFRSLGGQTNAGVQKGLVTGASWAEILGMQAAGISPGNPGGGAEPVKEEK